MTKTYPGTDEVYQPLVMTSGNHRLLVESYNVPYATLQTNREFQNNIDAFAEKPEIVELIAKGDTMNAVRKTVASDDDEWNIYENIDNHCRDASLIVTNMFNVNQALIVGKKYDIPVGQLLLFPFHQTGDFPFVVIDQLVPNWFRFLNRFSYDLVYKAGTPQSRYSFWNKMADDGGVKFDFRDWRAIKNVQEGFPTLYAMSPYLFPKPADYPASVELSGYFSAYSSQASQDSPPLSSRLTQIIQSARQQGNKLVYIGFGSMPIWNTDVFKKLVTDLDYFIQAYGVTILLFVGEASGEISEILAELSPQIQLISSSPHARLFPQCDLIIHHGGSGTTAAALLSGSPTFAVPIFADQFFNANRIADLYRKLGVGQVPKVVPFQKITGRVLFNNIQLGLNSDMHEAAEEIAREMRKEDAEAMNKGKAWIDKLIAQGGFILPPGLKQHLRY
ncbi:hypothetical protein MP228_006899 [Amoeboaphelidium protococcarum]|nr:hypothetical protein MP228_006899 [Amoeboaphelidium protococcarum]